MNQINISKGVKAVIEIKDANVIRSEILDLISEITPYDNLEKDHISNAIAWINSGEQIFRVEKPANPPKHLVVYTVLYNRHSAKLLLLYHQKAQLMLPSGGHVDINEHPKETAKRELLEELNLKAQFLNNSKPLFITETETVGLTAGHTDVTLWYMLEGDSSAQLSNGTDFNAEFGKYEWLNLEKILEMDITLLDPHMHRFVKKIKSTQF